MKINRPLSPHLSIYKPQLTSTLSIFHRISGSFLAISLFFIFLSIRFCDMSLSFYDFYWYFFFFINSLNWFISGFINLILLAFCYHISNGIRHILWDFGFFLDLSKVYATGAFTISLSLILFFLLNIITSNLF